MSGDPTLPQSGPDRVMCNTELLGDLGEANSLFAEVYRDFNVPCRLEMFAPVFSVTDQMKVGNAVIETVAVDVMNVLVRRKLSPEDLFHNSTVLVDFLPCDPASPVAVGSDMAPSFVGVVTSESAEHVGTNAGWTAGYIATAIKASDAKHMKMAFDIQRNIPTRSGYRQAEIIRKYGIAGLMAGGAGAAGLGGQQQGQQ